MKKIFAFVLISLASQAVLANYDGCYQLALPGTMLSKVCLQGTAEEGVGGANALLAVFGPNSMNLEQCVRSTRLSITPKAFVFQVGNVDTLTLTGFQQSKDFLIGDATMPVQYGPNIINFATKFVKLSDEESYGYFAIMNTKCKN